MKYIEKNKNIEISLTWSSILAAAYMRNIFTQTLVYLSTFRWFPRWIHDSREIDVFHKVKHHAKHRGISQHIFGLCMAKNVRQSLYYSSSQLQI